MNWNMYMMLGIILLFTIILASLFIGKKVERFSDAIKSKKLEYFYMPSCHHCQEFNNVWEDVKKSILKDNLDVKTQKHNIIDDDELAKKYNINAAPTILLINSDGSSKEYKGARDVNSIMSFLIEELK